MIELTCLLKLSLLSSINPRLLTLVDGVGSGPISGGQQSGVQKQGLFPKNINCLL